MKVLVLAVKPSCHFRYLHVCALFFQLTPTPTLTSVFSHNPLPAVYAQFCGEIRYMRAAVSSRIDNSPTSPHRSQETGGLGSLRARIERGTAPLGGPIPSHQPRYPELGPVSNFPPWLEHMAKVPLPQVSALGERRFGRAQDAPDIDTLFADAQRPERPTLQGCEF